MVDSQSSACSKSYYQDLISGKEQGPLASLFRSVLTGASAAYGLGVGLHQKRCASIAQRFSVPVVSIGNITVGGTGKTPAVISLAGEWTSRGKRVAVLSRGYGRSGPSNHTLVVSDGEKVLAQVPEAGDEPTLIAERVPGCVVIVGSNRRKSAELAIERFDAEILLLDDGFQHRTVHRDRDVVLIDALNPFGYGHLLPRGLLRESLEGLRRAHYLILTRCDHISEDDAGKIMARLKNLAPGAQVLKAVHAPVSVLDATDNSKAPPDSLRGNTIAGLCGIANPASFLRTLGELGANVAQEILFPDHHSYTERDLDRIVKQSEGLESVVTTEKDWVRLRKIYRNQFPLRVLQVDFQIQERAWPDDLLGVSQN